MTRYRNSEDPLLSLCKLRMRIGTRYHLALLGLVPLRTHPSNPSNILKTPTDNTPTVSTITLPLQISHHRHYPRPPNLPQQSTHLTHIQRNVSSGTTPQVHHNSYTRYENKLSRTCHSPQRRDVQGMVISCAPRHGKFLEKCTSAMYRMSEAILF